MNRKRLLSVLLIAICQNIAFSQVVPPQGISYQAVIINRNIKELPGKDITESYYSNMEMIVKFSILSSQTGPTEYEETQNAITDVYGLLNLVIGQGKPIGAAFNTIDWSINAKWLKVDIDFNKEGFFEPFSLEKMWSVPYAFYSEQSSDSLILKVNGTDRQLKLGEKSPIFFSVGEGWYSIIKELIEDLIELGWDKKIYQVKEKFGGLRFYITNNSDEINDRILKAELLSYKTCEVTGKRGELRNDLDWVRTLCEEEYKKAKEN